MVHDLASSSGATINGPMLTQTPIENDFIKTSVLNLCVYCQNRGLIFFLSNFFQDFEVKVHNPTFKVKFVIWTT